MRSWLYSILTVSLLLMGLPATAVVGISLTSLTLSPTTVTGGGPLITIPQIGRPSALGTVTLSGPAPAGGLAIGLSSSNTAVATVLASVTVVAGQTTAKFPIGTSPVASPTTVTISASQQVRGPTPQTLPTLVTKTATLTVVPPVLTSLTLNPTSVPGGASPTGTVALSGPAYSGGVHVTLASSNPTVARVLGPGLVPTPINGEATVTVPAGQSSASFTVSTQPVPTGTTTPVTIAAYYGRVTKEPTLTATLTVVPPSLDLVSCTPPGGKRAHEPPFGCKVWLDGPVAPNRSVTVNLATSNTAVAIVSPSSVVIASNHNAGDFTVIPQPIEQSQTATITAQYGDVKKTTTVNVLPVLIKGVSCRPNEAAPWRSECATYGKAPIGVSAFGLLSLTGKAGPGGLRIKVLPSSDILYTFLYTLMTVSDPTNIVLVPEGSDNVRFDIMAWPVASDRTVYVSFVSPAGDSTSVLVTVKPPIVWGLAFLTADRKNFLWEISNVPVTGQDVTAKVWL